MDARLEYVHALVPSRATAVADPPIDSPAASLGIKEGDAQ